MKRPQTARWQIAIGPTADGRGYKMDMMADPNVRPQVESLLDQLGTVLAEAASRG